MKKQNKNRGAALITVLVALMIISLMVMELQFNSMVERKLAMNELNQIQAYYLAKSGIRIGLLRVGLFVRAQNDSAVSTFLKGAGGKSSYLDLIWSIPLPAFPPPKGSLAKMTKSDKDAAEKVLEDTKITDGQFSQTISSEGSKINLNIFTNFPENRLGTSINTSEKPKDIWQYNFIALVNLINQFIRESDNPADEFGNLKPEELVMDIIDWVTPGNNRLAGGNKDTYYQQLNPPYKAKKGPFFTLEELKLVRGIDDHLYSKLKPHLTVSPEQGSININTAPDSLLSALIPDLREYQFERIKEEKARIGGNWSSVDEFVNYITSNLNIRVKDIYPEPNKYFTIHNETFIIDSLGIIKKSKAQVQKSIKVGVALVTHRSCAQQNSLNEEACKSKADKYWWNGLVCLSKVKESEVSDDTCQKCGAALTPDPAENNKMKCRTIGERAMWVPTIANTGSAPASGSGSSSGSGATATNSPPKPDGIKLLYWMES